MLEDTRTPEERRELFEESSIAQLIETDGWALVRDRAMQYVATLESVRTLPEGTNQDVGEEAKVRAKAIGIFMTWLNDIESIGEAKLQDAPPEYIRYE
jgi:hypothetical protein